MALSKAISIFMLYLSSLVNHWSWDISIWNYKII